MRKNTNISKQVNALLGVSKKQQKINKLKKRYSRVVDVQNELHDRAVLEYLERSDFNPADYLDEEDSELFCATVIELEELDKELDELTEVI